ncbi:hypothetical protein [Gilvimarinus sp. DA14]|uniref:hypothetical protein n=1 Tax=Gilvimarinus sp. DA14 TaxID=2956798 RepID=UPI0020B6F128|nr:hypothetical protein [Gilvimarinus sp. DA14]UTF59126.1 hypothetical protein NHM04_11640 [Gilvimarinus sp. DA14]
MSGEDKAPNKRRGQIQALLLMLVVALPMIAAYVIYHTGVGMPEGTVNKGKLLQPPQHLPDLPLRFADGGAWDFAEQPVRWRYVIPGSGSCDQVCRDNLYLTRQVHIRLNEKARRVERYYLLLDGAIEPQFAAYLEKEHPRLRIVEAPRAALNDALAKTNETQNPDRAGRYFLMDQEGYLMMSYGPNTDGADLLKDVKKMLKTSYEE